MSEHSGERLIDGTRAAFDDLRVKQMVKVIGCFREIAGT
jgi:hypothetical protein